MFFERGIFLIPTTSTHDPRQLVILVDTMIAQAKRTHLNNQSKQVVFAFRRGSLRELEKVVELTCRFQLARAPTEFLVVPNFYSYFYQISSSFLK